jgi:hypothetical protein
MDTSSYLVERSMPLRTMRCKMGEGQMEYWTGPDMNVLSNRSMLSSMEKFFIRTRHRALFQINDKTIQLAPSPLHARRPERCWRIYY